MQKFQPTQVAHHIGEVSSVQTGNLKKAGLVDKWQTLPFAHLFGQLRIPATSGLPPHALPNFKLAILYPFQKYFTLLLTLPWTAAMHYWEIPMKKQIRVPGHEFCGQGISPLLRLYCTAIVTLTFCRPFVCYAFGEQIIACPWKILKLQKERLLFQLTSLSPVRDFPLDMSQGPASPHSARQPRWCVWKFVLKREKKLQIQLLHSIFQQDFPCTKQRSSEKCLLHESIRFQFFLLVKNYIWQYITVYTDMARKLWYSWWKKSCTSW